MATEKEIETIDRMFKETKRNHFIHMFDDMNTGAFAVLKYLYENNFESTSGEITNFLKISSARVAFILKKLEEKNLITRTNSSTDARVTIVNLTKDGEKKCTDKKNELYKKINLIIDEVGFDKLYEINEIISKVNHIMKTEEKIIEGENTND